MATNMDRKKLHVKLERVYEDDFLDQPLSSIREKLDGWELQYFHHTNLCIEKNYSWDHEDGWWYLWGDTLETEEEFEKRKAKAAKECARRKEQKEKQRIKKEEKDRRDYERLKAKFEEEA